jgi:diguanylate cyclase (GGDEF)-like protein/PAS domain S-box-containing protein
MQLKNIKTYIQFIIYFIIFGISIAIITSVINYKNTYNDIQEVIHTNAVEALALKEEKIKQYIASIEKDILALEANQLLKNYLQQNTTENLTKLQNLFLLLSDSTEHYFQVRLLSNIGEELIRVDKNSFTKKSYLVPKAQLQNKSHRYYFQDSLNGTPGNFWYSKLDLNMENKKIELPYKPTYRVAKTLYMNNQLLGIIIININMNSLMEQLQKITNFKFYLVDKDGYFLIAEDKKYNWSRYLKTKYNFSILFPKEKKLLLGKKYDSQNFHAISLEHLFKNNENIKMVLQTDTSYITQLIDNNYKLAFYLGITILLISIPIGMILAITPTKIRNSLQNTLFNNKKYLNIIDKYVVTISVDLEGYITNVSSAMCKLSKYSKKELLGKKVSILKSGSMPRELYNELWETITQGEIWSGEIQNKKKNNTLYWLKMDILPQYNEENILFGYTSIAHDITSQKKIEKISERDSLTKLYNRMKIDKLLQYEKNLALRNNNPFSIIMIDIDYFKKINDTFGHQTGDCVLIQFAKISKEHIRNTDFVGRWGGEEFMIICPNTNITGVLELANKLRQKVESHQFTEVKKVTASFGVSTFNAHEGIEKLIYFADKALYFAKNSGRNCVKTYLNSLVGQ